MPPQLRYHLSNIRAFLTQGFSAEELYYLCYDDPELHSVVELVNPEMGTARVASQVLDFCRRRALLDRLLALACKENPGRYPLHLPYYVETGTGEPGLEGSKDGGVEARTTSLAPEAAIDEARKLKVFLCHASEDKPAVRELYRRLVESGVEPWLDEESLIGGQDWDREIRRALHETDMVLVCLSKLSVTKVGFVQKEIRRYVLDAADRQPEGATFVVPIRLDECDVPDSLDEWHRIDYYVLGGYERLLRALDFRAKKLGIRPPLV